MADKKRSKADLELDLASIVAGEIGAATHLDDSDASQQRSNEIDYYNGHMPDLVAPFGKSQVVSRDTSDVIGWMQPGIARLFLSSDRMAMFEETKPEQAEHADHVTISANHTFLKDNPGYEILNEATFDALLHGDGFVKAFWDDTPETEVSEHTGLSEDQLSYLLQDENVEVILFNIFGGITRCDDVAKGIIEATNRLDIKVPVVVRLTGTNEEEARVLLQGTDLVPAETMDEVVQKALELASN